MVNGFWQKLFYVYYDTKVRDLLKEESCFCKAKKLKILTLCVSVCA